MLRSHVACVSKPSQNKTVGALNRTQGQSQRSGQHGRSMRSSSRGSGGGGDPGCFCRCRGLVCVRVCCAVCSALLICAVLLNGAEHAETFLSNSEFPSLCPCSPCFSFRDDFDFWDFHHVQHSVRRSPGRSLLESGWLQLESW